MGNGARAGSEPLDDDPCHCPQWLDAKKKTLIAHERDGRKRAAWRRAMRRVSARRLVFVDECGVQTDRTPRYARAPRGQRAYGRVPQRRRRNTTVVASLTHRGAGPAMAIPGAMNAVAFVAYLQQVLIPTLVRGQIVVMDNRSAHRNARVAPLLPAAGCRVVYLPVYSPDCNPIEEMFSKVKGNVRKAEARTHDALVVAVGAALETVPARDARGWFRHRGYRRQLPHPQ